ncbi:hypothetical protein ACFRNJ_31110 [Streptomyces sp. NPDC056721]|uniref:hypothetical protein n=1 Tax=Streptomyces sp. NPDC056721 TaxID=3345923 RepID=UPI003694A47A
MDRHPSSSSEPLLGVWPGLPGRPRIIHSARDWLTKLQLVAGGFGVTTVASGLSPVLPPGVSLLRVDGAPTEIRRVLVARLPANPPRRSRPTPERSLRPSEPPPRPRTIACTPFPSRVGTTVTVGLFSAVLALSLAVVTALHELLAPRRRAQRPSAARLPPRQAARAYHDSIRPVPVSNDHDG